MIRMFVLHYSLPPIVLRAAAVLVIACLAFNYCYFVRIGGEQDALQEVYGDDVDLCDTLVGNLAEDKIEGFAIR